MAGRQYIAYQNSVAVRSSLPTVSEKVNLVQKRQNGLQLPKDEFQVCSSLHMFAQQTSKYTDRIFFLHEFYCTKFQPHGTQASVVTLWQLLCLEIPFNKILIPLFLYRPFFHLKKSYFFVLYFNFL